VKILNINMSIDPIRGGGTAERTVQMSRALANNGHQCTILTLDLGITDARKSELNNVKIVALPCLVKRFYIPRLNFFKTSQLINESDIIHLMGHWTILNAVAYYYIRKHKKKYVVCPAGALPLFGRSKLLKKIYNAIIGKKIIQNANAHIVIAKDEIAHYASYGVSENKIVWIPNGIDQTSFQFQNDQLFREKFGIGSSPFILFIGRLNLIKGPDLLVEAFGKIKNNFPDIDLVIAGPDEGLFPLLKRLVSQYQIDSRVHFIGHVSGETKSQALHAALLMAIPSRQEAMSIVVLEAGVVGLPALITDQCGLNYLENINSAIITKATVESICDGLNKAMNDRENLKLLGKNLKEHVSENYLWPSIVKKFEILYDKILSN